MHYSTQVIASRNNQQKGNTSINRKGETFKKSKFRKTADVDDIVPEICNYNGPFFYNDFPLVHGPSTVE